MRGKFPKRCSAGVDIAERVSINEEMTSVEAGWMVTRFADRRGDAIEEQGNERRCCSFGRREVRAGMTGAYSAIVVEGMSNPLRRSGKGVLCLGKSAVSLLQGSCPESTTPVRHLRAEAIMYLDSPPSLPCNSECC